jgi:HPt (histidine-containing phosphotransfer) domain-containing protein
MDDPRFDAQPMAMLRRVGTEALAKKMIDLFLTSAPARVAAIHEGNATGDLEIARAAAHSLKSSAGQLGAVALQDLCRQIEDAATRKDAPAVAALVPPLDTELAAAESWLRSGA